VDTADTGKIAAAFRSNVSMNYNRIILIGRLATDPELKYTPSGIAVTQFRLAVNRPISSEARAQGTQEQADFIDIAAWRQNAEYAANYLQKGRLVLVEGRLQIRDYVDKEGQKRKATEVVADNIKGLDRRPDGEGGEQGGSFGGNSFGGGRSDQDQRPAPQQRPAYGAGAPPARPAPTGNRNAPPAQNDAYNDMDDFNDPFAE
jgi:single-strand DNA-binding protein